MQEQHVIQLDSSFITEVDRLSGQQVELCYHCHTCTAGCPLSMHMTYGPDRLLRLIELGERERVLLAPDIWLCASCETCTARCPNEIDVAAIMDTLRHLSCVEEEACIEPHINLFHGVYLNVIQRFGRSHEVVMLAIYKMRSLDLFSDMGAGLRLVIRGKIPLIPRRIRGAAQVKRIFEAAHEADIKQMESGS